MVQLLGKIVWRLQQISRIPYLKCFSNQRRTMPAFKCCPGMKLSLNAIRSITWAWRGQVKNFKIPYMIFFDADQIAELEFMGKPLTGWLLWRARNLLRENLAAAQRIICVSKPAKDHLMTEVGRASE